MSNNTVNLNGFLSIEDMHMTPTNRKEQNLVVRGWVQTGIAALGGRHPLVATGTPAQVILEYARLAASSSLDTHFGVSLDGKLAYLHPNFRLSKPGISAFSIYPTRFCQGRSVPVLRRQYGHAPGSPGRSDLLIACRDWNWKDSEANRTSRPASILIPDLLAGITPVLLSGELAGPPATAHTGPAKSGEFSPLSGYKSAAGCSGSARKPTFHCRYLTFNRRQRRRSFRNRISFQAPDPRKTA